MKLIRCTFLHLLAAVFLPTCWALYESDSDVIELTASNFNSKVIDSDHIWLVEFFAPWCGHCQSMAPEYVKAAKALKSVVRLGAVNMDQHGSLGQTYQVKGFPTILVFGTNKQSPVPYNGQRTARAFVDTALDAVKSSVVDRLSGSSKSSGSGRQEQGSDSEDAVVELTDSNFEQLVLKSKDLWLVEFFAPWCGHCKRLEPEWKKAAKRLQGKVKLGALDSTVHNSMSSRYGVQGFPTIKVFSADDKSAPEDYSGGRTADDIVAYAEQKLADSLPPPEVEQLVDQSVLKSNCLEKPLCVVAVLPDIYDTMAEGRKNYIKILKDLGEKHRKKMWGWVWTESLAHPNLEQAFGMGGFGYPAMVIVNARKKVYVTLKGPFSADGIDELVKTVAVGRGSSEPIQGGDLPSISAAPAWDGADPPSLEEGSEDDAKEEL